MPLPSAPSTSSDAALEVRLPQSRRSVGDGCVGPEPGALDVGDEAGEVGDDRHRQMLDGTRRGPADGGRDPGGTVGREHEARRSRTFRAAADGAEVVRIGDAVEADKQRLRALRELVGVGVPVGLAEGDDTLVIACSRELCQLSLGSDPHARRALVAEPGLGAQSPLARMQLEHATRAA